MNLDIVILAAGQGTRMRSALPKVLHPVAGRPMLVHVLATAASLHPRNKIVVVGHGAEKVGELLPSDTQSVVQAEQLGTGHAVQQVLPLLPEQGQSLVLYGDVPLIEYQSLQRLIEQSPVNGIGVMTALLDDPSGYGRIVRDADGQLSAIVEHKDASDDERQIREINSGIMVIANSILHQYLSILGNDNAQGEYYLTDLIALACREQLPLTGVQIDQPQQILGVNDKRQLAQVERLWQRQHADRLLDQGVTLADPDRLDIRGDVRVGQDVFIDVNVVFEGHVSLADGVTIGANCVLTDCNVGPNSEIRPFSVLEQAEVGGDCQVGPYARLRPGTVLADEARIGNFVETKKSHIGLGSKVNHLSYIGDAEVGDGVNIGAGTITCNYDGVNKHRTEIGDGAFIGSNTALVAPVSVGVKATVGAGSTVTKTVEDGQLAIARGQQRNIKKWPRPQKKDQ